ncbi:hypothetical protein CLV44_12719 [Marinobacterium halophilum]|uniref:Lipoprotein n=1 Tax=Marinobacterium halophilum TaxID=267374 RepID=A0A2P8ELA8_9GAMM|nr:hypothetical protein [Marinobacterium halophilum]PSL10257.1 hypothetical protein CLV44_12719 [Marinobacterium halophilum]
MKRYLAPIAAVFMLMACSSDVEFTPKTGDERAYWLLTDTRVDIGGRVQSQSSRALMRYQVEATAPDLHMTLIPEYMEMDGGGSSSFNSLATPDDDDELYQLLSSGFDMTLDAETGQMKAFSGRDSASWAQVLERSGDQLVEELSKGLSTPGLLQSIPAKVGTEVDLAEFNGYPAQLKVVNVTDTQLTATLSSTSAKGRIYAELTQARDSGWLEQMLLVIDAPFSMYGRTGQVRTRLAMLPEDAPAAHLGNYLSFSRGDEWYEIVHPEQDLTGIAAPTPAQVFAYDHGVYTDEVEGVNLQVLHSLDQVTVPADVIFNQVRAYDAEGVLLPVRFANVGGFSLSDFDGPVRSWSSLLPLGWDQQANLEQIHSYKAEVALQPHYMQVHTFDWTPGQEQVHDLEGIDLRITPVAGLAQVYKIEINTHGSTRYPLHYFGGVEGRMQWQDVGLGPAWLTPGERNLFNAYQQNKGSLSWRLELDEQPEQISVYLVLPEAQPSARREITFISPEVFARDPEMPPLEQHYLFGPPWQYRGKTTLDFNPEQPAMLDESGQSGQSGQSAQAVLPGEWSAACTLEVTDAEPVNGHALEWRPVDECREQECDNLYLHQQQAYELATDDGEQRYFYGREVSSRLSCQGVPQ